MRGLNLPAGEGIVKGMGIYASLSGDKSVSAGGNCAVDICMGILMILAAIALVASGDGQDEFDLW